MSVNRDMKKYMLQKKSTDRSPSGGKKESRADVGEIDVAVYKNTEMVMYASERYKESTHTGLTYSKGIKAEISRLFREGSVYRIVSCNEDGRLTVFLLKEVDANV